MAMKYDFSGWATKNNIRCSDGRTIRKDAFKHDDGKVVPLVWQHQHKNAENVLGQVLLENRPDGVYAYGSFNESRPAQHAKELLRHGDINALSIFANELQQHGGDVMHGVIKEVSLVLAGANPGALIDFPILAHGDESEAEATIYTGETIDVIADQLEHADESKEEEKNEMANNEKTVKDVFDELTEEQKNVVYYIIGEALNSKGDNDTNEEADAEMKHNAFEAMDYENENVLSHSDFLTLQEDTFRDAKRLGSLKDSFLAHAEEYGIQDIDWLFPQDKNLNNPPEFIKRDDGWVSKVMGAVHHTPFSRIKSTYADLTEDEARAKGYIKGKMKKEEVFSLLKRSTSPTTIYKKQKMDRDDIIDITDFDVIAWLKGEMRMMLNEEIARAIMIGDGRLASDDDHIDPTHIRPVVADADLFTIRWGVAGSTEDDLAKNFIRAAIKSRKDYKGSGSPTLYTTEDMLTSMLLLEDTIGHKLYKTEAELATALRVKEIVTVPVMEGFEDADDKEVYGIIVNLNDYNVGADKGGEVNMFDDFDIDYNQQKYLMETRCSGALVKPFSAIVLRSGDTTASQWAGRSAAMAEFKA